MKWWILPMAVYAIIFMVFATSALLVSEIPMFALKFKNFTFKDNKVRYVFLVVSLAFIIAFGIGGCFPYNAVIVCLGIYRIGRFGNRRFCRFRWL